MPTRAETDGRKKGTEFSFSRSQPHGNEPDYCSDGCAVWKLASRRDVIHTTVLSKENLSRRSLKDTGRVGSGGLEEKSHLFFLKESWAPRCG